MLETPADINEIFGYAIASSPHMREKINPRLLFSHVCGRPGDEARYATDSHVRGRPGDEARYATDSHVRGRPGDEARYATDSHVRGRPGGEARYATDSVSCPSWI